MNKPILTTSVVLLSCVSFAVSADPCADVEYGTTLQYIYLSLPTSNNNSDGGTIGQTLTYNKEETLPALPSITIIAQGICSGTSDNIFPVILLNNSILTWTSLDPNKVLVNSGVATPGYSTTSGCSSISASYGNISALQPISICLQMPTF